MFHYDLISTWEKKLENIEARRMQIAVSMIPDECKTLIDLGTGDGSLIYAIENSIDPLKKIKCRGFERSENAIKMKKCISDIELREDFHFKENENQSDIVVSMAVLEHLKDSEVNLKKDLIEKISKKYLLVSVPYKEKRVNVRCPHCGCCFDPHWHLRSYDISSLSRLFSKWNIKKTHFFKTKSTLFDIIIRYFGITLSAKKGTQKICPLCTKISHKEIVNNDKNNDITDDKRGLKQLFYKILKTLIFFQVNYVSEIFILFEKKA